MNKPVLVIMAAGLGSRYGGSKQIDPVDDQGHILMDFSLYDARRAGFEKVIFIIREEHKEVFDQMIGKRIADRMEAVYAFQELSDIPEGFEVPEGRSKPWGTGHAVLSAASQIDGPFAVINADDYYGREAFSLIFDYLTTHQDDDKYRYAMVGYQLGNTLSDTGHVARGVCKVDSEGYLQEITERTRIIRKGNGAAWSEDDGATWHEIDPMTPVSMNLWGFSEGFMQELRKGFPQFLNDNLPVNPLKCEYFLPSAVDRLLRENKATVKVLRTSEKWFGMTYKEDREQVIRMIQNSKEKGIYPENF